MGVIGWLKDLLNPPAEPEPEPEIAPEASPSPVPKPPGLVFPDNKALQDWLNHG